MKKLDNLIESKSSNLISNNWKTQSTTIIKNMGSTTLTKIEEKNFHFHNRKKNQQ